MDFMTVVVLGQTLHLTLSFPAEPLEWGRFPFIEADLIVQLGLGYRWQGSQGTWAEGAPLCFLRPELHRSGKLDQVQI